MRVAIPGDKNDVDSEDYDKVPSLHDTAKTLKNTYKQLSSASDQDSDKPYNFSYDMHDSFLESSADGSVKGLTQIQGKQKLEQILDEKRANEGNLDRIDVQAGIKNAIWEHRKNVKAQLLSKFISH